MSLPCTYDEKTNEELLAEYGKTKDQSIKQAIVLRYVYLIKNIAIQYRGVYASFAQLDDIVNEGIIALMNAVDKYDSEKNARFDTYVSKRLKGLIIDIARKQDWVPRNVRKESKEIDNASNILFDKLGRYPTSKEVADHLNLSLDKYYKVLGKSNMYNIISLDNYINDQMTTTGSDGIVSKDKTPEEELEKKELLDSLKDGLMSLREKEQLVLSLYYRKELSMKEIAEVMDLSEARISQIHANSIRKLRMYMEKNLSS